MKVYPAHAIWPMKTAATRLGYRAAVEAFWKANPNATQEQVRRATGAPRKTVRKVFDAMILAGRLVRAKAMVLHCDDE